MLQGSHSNNLLLREERKTRSLQAAGEAAALIWRSTLVGTVTLSYRMLPRHLTEAQLKYVVWSR